VIEEDLTSRALLSVSCVVEKYSAAPWSCQGREARMIGGHIQKELGSPARLTRTDDAEAAVRVLLVNKEENMMKELPVLEPSMRTQSPPPWS
jgi:hypothetical protein